MYADGGYELDAEQRAYAAFIASGGRATFDDGSRRLRAVACGRTAARLYGLPLIDDSDPATGAWESLLDDVATTIPAPQLRQRQQDGSVRVLTRHERAFRPGDVRVTATGLYVTSVLRTLVDCAGLLTHEALVCAIDAALNRRLVSATELQRVVASRAWCPSVAVLRRAVGEADGRAEAPTETLARLLLLPVLPGLVPQVRLLDAHGRVIARFDLGEERLRLAVEADGKVAHAGERMAAKDQRRDRSSDREGWKTERCLWHELRRQKEALVRRVLATAGDQALRYGLA